MFEKKLQLWSQLNLALVEKVTVVNTILAAGVIYYSPCLFPLKQLRNGWSAFSEDFFGESKGRHQGSLWLHGMYAHYQGIKGDWVSLVLYVVDNFFCTVDVEYGILRQREIHKISVMFLVNYLKGR